jgi:hypothetical protein
MAPKDVYYTPGGLNGMRHSPHKLRRLGLKRALPKKQRGQSWQMAPMTATAAEERRGKRVRDT